MNRIKKLLSLLILINLIGCLSAMEQQPIAEFIKIREIPNDQKVIADAGGKIVNCAEYIDLNAEDPITYVPFNELISQRAEYGIPYILSVVSYTQQDPPAIRHTYYDAVTINEILFGDIKKSKSKNNQTLCKYSFTKKLTHLTHPGTRAEIDSVTYIALDPIKKTATVIGTSTDIQDGSVNQQIFTRLFSGTKAFDQELLGEKNTNKLKVLAKRIREHYHKIASNLKDNKK